MNTAKAKLKDASQEERIHMWKQHFENYLENLRKLRVNKSQALLGIHWTSN